MSKNKTAMMPDEKSHGLDLQREPRKKWPIIHFFSDDFGLRSPVIQKTFDVTREESVTSIS